MVSISDAITLTRNFTFSTANFPPRQGDTAIQRLIYPLKGGPATGADIQRNAHLDKENLWGERIYFFNCHRDSADFVWFANNLSSAPGAPKPNQITAAWTFVANGIPKTSSAR
jgi:pectinesterase